MKAVAKVCVVLSMLVTAGALLTPTQRYAAEVGYCKEPRDTHGYCHEEPLVWDIWGEFPTLSDCRSAATSRYGELWRSGQAHDWSCLLKNGQGGYASRYK